MSWQLEPAVAQRAATRPGPTVETRRQTRGMAADQQEPIDPRNNPESRATERAAETPVSRGGSGSVAPADQAPPLEPPADGGTGGTADGDPLGGVTAGAGNTPDTDDAVEGQAGPEPTGLGQRGRN